MSGRVTIKSIAKDLGISHMTVSRALSNNPNVSKEKRAAIQKRAKELGYVKSAAAKTMRGDGTKIVGLLLPNIVNEFYARFANTMAQACEAQSLHMIIHLTNDDPEKERLSLERLKEVQAMAVVMVPTPEGTPEPAPSLAGMKVIQLIRQRDENAAMASILIKDHDAIRDAVLHLARGGHKSIAYIGATPDLSSGRARLEAYTDGLQSAGIDADSRIIFTEEPSYEMGRNACSHILAGGIATALVCGGVEISNGALSILMDRGLNLQRDIAFIGYGDPSFYSWIGGGVTTIQLPVDELAHHTVALFANGAHSQVHLNHNVTEFAAELIVR